MFHFPSLGGAQLVVRTKERDVNTSIERCQWNKAANSLLESAHYDCFEPKSNQDETDERKRSGDAESK